MAYSILTPLSLWKNFDDKQALNEFIVKRETIDGISYSFLCFSGRQTKTGRVRIYALYACPERGESFPALLYFPDAGKAFDTDFINRFVKLGYAVLAVDYSGRTAGRERFTVYPEDVAYANFEEVGRRMDFVDTDASETAWYEWTAVGRYAVQYLKSRPDVTKIGVIGVRTGGEIAWKLMLSPDVSCGVPICAAGWLTFRGMNKFGKTPDLVFDHERQRFLAGIDSQVYAPFVTCPVLMLCSTNDPKFDYDRAYDTYLRINQNVDCVISYSVHNSSYIGMTGLNDLDMFLAKYLKGRQVFIPKPLDISIFVDQDGDLVAEVVNDQLGEIETIRLFLSEDCAVSFRRDWREMKRIKVETEEKIVFYLDAYEKCKTVFAFAQAEYSSGFESSSKVAYAPIEKPFRNGVSHSRIIYREDQGTECFSSYDVSDKAIGDCILDDEKHRPVLIEGYKGIKGIACDRGLQTFRINNSVCRPTEDALLQVDFCSWESGYITICIEADLGGTTNKFYRSFWVNGSHGWENAVLQASEFKTESAQPMKSFADAISVSFFAEFKFCLNNLLWL